MSDNDYAIVVGISRYPNLAPPAPQGSPNHLEGAEKDAEEVFEWLTDQEKGNVPLENAWLITSSEFDNDEDKKPTPEDIVGAFKWLHHEAVNRKTIYLGRRLYIYFAGHGFCVQRRDGGVYTTDATPVFQQHFYTSAWFEWFYKNAAFEEYVLWVDACADPIVLPAPQSPPLAQQVSSTAAQGKVFIAFSARHPLRSVERRMPDGNIRGAFTYALLEGLKGASAEDGHITSDSLERWMKGSLTNYMTAEDRANPFISNTPDFDTNDLIVFSSSDAKTFQVTFKIAEHMLGALAEIEDSQTTVVASHTIDSDHWELYLEPGFYKFRSEAGNFEHLFEVKGNISDAILIG